ncbi:C25 family cysteine peptidase [Corallococcus interemptor]|uniref:C25 family cysteine peptidase n=1 Tax=Corallococcus interemptor TaxID=2316720 RepID=UPI003D00E4DF
MERPIASPEDPLVLNGIDGVTGQYLVPPIALPAAAEVAEPGENTAAFEAWRKWLRFNPTRLPLDIAFDINRNDYTQAGWGVVFAEATPDKVRKALEPLIAHRHSRVTESDRAHVLAYKAGETADQFLERHGAILGDIEPDRVPYYLLLVGGPEAIPFDVQHSLSLNYAVGRLSFDTPGEYARYADSVVAYETDASVASHRLVSGWGPRHLGDRSTELSADHLVLPLFRGADVDQPPAPKKGLAAKVRYASREAIEDDATKDWLLSQFHGRTERPAVLFTASHGVAFSANDPLQRSNQGALLTQDWTGFGAMAPAHYVAASDIQDDARLHGLVAFFFACFGMGTPLHDEFPLNATRSGEALANAPFVAALPRRLLSHPGGGALAVIGHVERAWGFSIKPLGTLRPTLHPFQNTLWKIMSGIPVGQALRDFRDRFASLNNILLTHLDANTSNGKLQPRELLHRWIERNDARNYVVLGDPAVSIRHKNLQALP